MTHATLPPLDETRPDHPPVAVAALFEAGSVVAGRYLLGDVLGAGGYGTVFAAVDRLTGRAVAVKVMVGLRLHDLARVRREVAALRLLRLPGVVQLLDEGEERGGRFLVMELLSGTHFPGGRGSDWPSLAPVALGLLEAIGRVHGAGVVHRDLKPPNVLVDAEGRPTILDFGISRGDPVGATITMEGSLVGTPAYLAPEQILGQRADVRSDLYAIGVMLFEALAGRPPHVGASPTQIMQARVTQHPPALRAVAPHVPGHIADVIDRVLAPLPQNRPGSAAEILGMLRGRAPSPQTELPWLGDATLIDAVLDDLTSGRAATVIGPQGSGKTRLLREVVQRLDAAAQTVHWLLPSRRPFGSLGTLAPPESALRGLDLPAATEFVAHHVAVQHAGRLLVADDWEQLDRWSTAALTPLLPHIRLLRATTTHLPGGHALRPLDEGALRQAFRGHQRLLHVPEDAARMLFLRTEGQPAAVMAELDAWQRAGLARREEGAFVVSRAAIDRLAAVPLPADPVSSALQLAMDASPRGVHVSSELAADPHLRELLGWLQLAWPHTQPAFLAEVLATPRWRLEAALTQLVDMGVARLHADGRVEARLRLPGESVWDGERLAAAHLAVARSLPLGAELRLFHLVAGGNTDAVADEAEKVLRVAMGRGQLGQVEVVLTEALRVIRREPHAPGERKLLNLLAEVAWATGTVRALELARYETLRAQPDPQVVALGVLLDVAMAAARTGGAEVLREANALTEFADEAIDAIRLGVQKHAARACPLADDEAVVARCNAWAAQRGTALAAAQAATWTARLRYRQGRYDEAAALNRQALVGDALPLHLRLTTMTYAASALESAFRYEEANAMAAAALRLADETRQVQACARAERVLRTTAYRAEQPLTADLEWVAAVASADLPHLCVLVTFTEAIIAWRSGDAVTCRRLAGEGLVRARRLQMAPFADVLVLLLANVDPQQARPDPAQVAEVASASGSPDVQIQLLALAALALGTPQPRWLELADRCARELGPAAAKGRLDILSLAEARQAIASGRLV